MYIMKLEQLCLFLYTSGKLLKLAMHGWNELGVDVPIPDNLDKDISVNLAYLEENIFDHLGLKDMQALFRE